MRITNRGLRPPAPPDPVCVMHNLAEDPCPLCVREDRKNVVGFVVFAVLAIAVLAACALCGCESQNIDACGYSCKQAGAKMKSYSTANGCQCDVPTSVDGGR